MDGFIRERLLTSEEDFLNAISNDISAVETCRSAWETLSDELHRAVQSHSLENETIELAYATTSRIKIISEGLLDFYDNASKLRFELDSDFAKLSLAAVVNSDYTHSPTSIVTRSPYPALGHRGESPDISTPSTTPPYIAPAYKWLLENLHEPYPSNEVKRSISDSTGTDIRHVNAWFMNIRRRMGWTSISRKHFSSSRAETVDAAYRILVAEDPKRPLDFKVRSDFMKMKVAANSLYSEIFKKSILAAKLDVAVKDLTDGDRDACIFTKAPADNDQGRAQNNNATERECALDGASSSFEVSPARPELSYPSPHWSPSTSPEPHSLDSSSEPCEENSTLSVPVAGRKRRMSSSSSESDDGSYNRPNKRNRPVFTTPTMALPPSPKSPIRTVIDPPDSGWKDAFHSSDFIPQSTCVSRKRRLSDVNSLPTPKRPRGLSRGPRLQAVSDPLPVSNATREELSQFEHWYKDHFELPDPVTDEELDSSTLVDIATNNGWTFLGSPSVEAPSTNLPPVLYQQASLSDYPSRASEYQGSNIPLPSNLITDYNAESNTPLHSVASAELCPSTTQEPAFLTENWSAMSADCTAADQDFLATDINDRFSCLPLSVACSSPISPFENDLSYLFNAEDLLSLPKWSLISASIPEHEDQLSTISFPAIDSVETFDDCWAQYSPALPFDHNPNHPNSSPAFFDDIISQEIPNIDSALLVPLAPSSIKHSYEDRVMAEKQAKLEQLQRHLEEVRKLEAELAL